MAGPRLRRPPMPVIRTAGAHDHAPSPWAAAVALSLATAVSLGFARFAYALLLPEMRTDLSWSHVTAGAMSGVLFGAVFLSVVASTTALVRHNAPPEHWPAGIAAFTIVFSMGQIAGPVFVGWIADGSGGVARGFLVSAAVLGAGSALAWRQKPLRAS